MRDQVRRIAEEARAASGALAQTSADERNGALASMAAALRSHAAAIVEANGCDMDAARKAGTKEGLLDRLMLDEDRVEAMAAALEDLVALPDPLGAVQQKRTLESGIELQRVSVPLGVVAVVYEARPNVTADAAGICLKSGNAAVLRGGSMAAASNEVIARVLHEAAVEAGMPRGCIGAVTLADRAAADELMQLHGVVDVLIPRGGAGLIRHCVETSKVPVIETGTGNCHVYVHESADYDKARAIIVNAKCRRLGVCNAAETLLVDEAAAEGFLPAALAELAARGVTLHADEHAAAVAAAGGTPTVPAGEADWETEYLAADLAVRVVGGVDEAIGHVNRYGTKHSEAIVAEDEAAVEAFLARVDGVHRRSRVRPGRRDRHLDAEAACARPVRARCAHFVQVRAARIRAGARVVGRICDHFDDLGRDGGRARLGIMGGTFDPIHIGHLACAEQAREAYDLDGVVFVPAGNPVFKKDRPVTPAAERLEMCRIATRSNPAFDVSAIEIERGGDTYTVDTLRQLRAHYPDNVELRFITGADAVYHIVQWRESAAIADLARLIAVTRPGYALSEERRAFIAEHGNFAIDYREVTALAISSSDLRRRVAAGKSIRYLTMQGVLDYIQERGLYRADPHHEGGVR